MTSTLMGSDVRVVTVTDMMILVCAARTIHQVHAVPSLMLIYMLLFACKHFSICRCTSNAEEYIEEYPKVEKRTYLWFKDYFGEVRHVDSLVMREAKSSDSGWDRRKLGKHGGITHPEASCILGHGSI